MTVIRTGALGAESGGMSVPGVVRGRTRATRRGRRPAEHAPDHHLLSLPLTRHTGNPMATVRDLRRVVKKSQADENVFIPPVSDPFRAHGASVPLPPSWPSARRG